MAAFELLENGFEIARLIVEEAFDNLLSSYLTEEGQKTADRMVKRQESMCKWFLGTLQGLQVGINEWRKEILQVSIQ